MKKILIFLLAVICMTSCYTSEDQKRLQQECSQLAAQSRNLRIEVNRLSNQKATLYKEVSDLRAEKGIYSRGKEPVYLVKFKVKQGTFSLSPGEHIKNEMNAIEMEMPVSRDFYNRLKIGDDLMDKFKGGSFWIDGDLSWLHMKVVSKRIK